MTGSNGRVLAAAQGLGSVYDCGNCGNIHLHVGAINITLDPAAYMHFVAMVSASAANFELWMEEKDPRNAE